MILINLLPIKKSNSEKKIVSMVLQKIYPEFVTTDGEFHIGKRYNWCKVSDLNCTSGEYAMISVTNDKYMIDINETIYPLYNIVSIVWIVEQEKIFKDSTRASQMYQVWFSDDEVSKFKEF